MFKEQAIRLLREGWTGAKQLAEEVYAVLSQEGDLTHDGSITIRPKGDQPAVIIQRGTDAEPDAPNIVIRRVDPTTGTIGDTSITLTGGGGGGGTGGGVAFPDPGESGDSSGGPYPPDPPQLPAGAVGRVVSGSGRDYTVDVWLADPEGGAAPPWGRVPAAALNLSPEDTIPAGVFVPVTCHFVARANGKTAMVAYITVGPAVWVEEP